MPPVDASRDLQEPALAIEKHRWVNASSFRYFGFRTVKINSSDLNIAPPILSFLNANHSRISSQGLLRYLNMNEKTLGQRLEKDVSR